MARGSAPPHVISHSPRQIPQTREEFAKQIQVPLTSGSLTAKAVEEKKAREVELYERMEGKRARRLLPKVKKSKKKAKKQSQPKSAGKAKITPNADGVFELDSSSDEEDEDGESEEEDPWGGVNGAGAPSGDSIMIDSSSEEEEDEPGYDSDNPLDGNNWYKIRRRMPPKPQPLGKYAEKAVDELFKYCRGVGRLRLFAKLGNARVNGFDVLTLRPGQWLNDEVINGYVAYLNERSQADDWDGPKIFAHTTFFYETLARSGVEKVLRWSRKPNWPDLATMDKVIVPIHLGNHWTLAVINIEEERYEYYDSMGGEHASVLEHLREYWSAEIADKHPDDDDMQALSEEVLEWDEAYGGHDTPQQQNGFDCGVFMVTTADYVARNAELNFHQKHMPSFRKRMVVDLLGLHPLRPGDEREV